MVNKPAFLDAKAKTFVARFSVTKDPLGRQRQKVLRESSGRTLLQMMLKFERHMLETFNANVGI